MMRQKEMNSLVEAQALLDDKKVVESFAVFLEVVSAPKAGKESRSGNKQTDKAIPGKKNASILQPGGLQAFQLAQKLAAELFRMEEFSKSHQVCVFVQEWANAKENLSLEDIVVSSATKPSKVQLAKLEIWAYLTDLQCLVKLERIEDEIIANAEQVIHLMKESSEYIDAAIVGSTAKKVWSVLASRKSIEARILALRFRREVGIQIDDSEATTRVVLNLIRDLRVKKLFSKVIEAELEWSVASLKLTCFEFALWVNELGPDKAKGAAQLSSAARTPKECMFAAKALYQQGMIKEACAACLRTIDRTRVEHENNSESVQDDALAMYVKLTLDDTSMTCRLLCELSHDLAEKEFILVCRSKRLDQYLRKLMSAKEPVSLLYKAKCLRVLERNSEALEISTNIKSHSGHFLTAILHAEIGSINASLQIVRKLVDRDSDSLPKMLRRELVAFAWMIGFYEEAVALNDKIEPGESFLNNLKLLRLGSSSARAVESNGGDADFAIRMLVQRVGESNGGVSSEQAGEFETLFDLVESLKTLGDLYRERGLCRFARYYYSKARGLCSSRKLVGEEERIREKLNVLDKLKTAGTVTILAEDDMERSDEDPRASTTTEHIREEQDRFRTYFEKVFHSKMQQQPSGHDEAPPTRFESILTEHFSWYEQARNLFHVREDPAQCSALLLSHSDELHCADTLLARALLEQDCQDEELILAAIERCQSDLVILRELYLRLLLIRKSAGDRVEEAFLIHSLVGLTLRAERYNKKQGEKEGSEEADLYHWHRLAKLKDSARVQRSQVQARLDPAWACCALAYDAKTNMMFLCRTERDKDFSLSWNVAECAPALLHDFAELMRRNHASTTGSTLEFAQQTMSDKDKKALWWEERYDLEHELGLWLERFERKLIGWRRVFLTGQPQKAGVEDRAHSCHAADKKSSRESRQVAFVGEEDDDEQEVVRDDRGAAKAAATSTTTAKKKNTKAGLSKPVVIKPLPASSRRNLSLTEQDPELDRFRDDDHAAEAKRRIVFADDLADGDERLNQAFKKKLTLRATEDDETESYLRLCLDSMEQLEVDDVAEALVNLCPGKFESKKDALVFLERKQGKEQRQPTRSGPVLLSLSGSLQQIPWESIPTLIGHRVSRVSSLPFALERYPRPRSKKRTYIVDPDNNLTRTRDTLKPKLNELMNSSGSSETVWEGIMGRPKSMDAAASISTVMKQYLENSALVVYCGHGGGEEYLNRDQVSKMEHCAPTLLIGCSSGNRRDLGVFEPNGIIDAYTLASSPLVVGNLWNVTDKDIDRFTLEILTGLQSGNNDLLDLVAGSRKACKLQKLVGAAPVCFGVPWVL